MGQDGGWMVLNCVPARRPQWSLSWCLHWCVPSFLHVYAEVKPLGALAQSRSAQYVLALQAASQSPADSLWHGVLVCWDAVKIGAALCETVHTGEVCSLWRWGWYESWKSLIEEHQAGDLCRCVLRLCIPSQDNCSPGVWSEWVGPVTLHTSLAVHFHSSSLHRNPSPEPGVTPHSSQSLCYLMGITKGRNGT